METHKGQYLASVLPYTVNLQKFQEVYGNFSDIAIQAVFLPLHSEFVYVVKDSLEQYRHLLTGHNFTFRCRNLTAFVDGIPTSPYSGLCDRGTIK